MSVTLEDKEDISGNPLLLISHIRPMELGIVWGVKNTKKLIRFQSGNKIGFWENGWFFLTRTFTIILSVPLFNQSILKKSFLEINDFLTKPKLPRYISFQIHNLYSLL